MDELKRIVAARHCPKRHKWAEIQAVLRPDADSTGAVRGPYVRRDKTEFPKGLVPVACPICVFTEKTEGKSALEEWKLRTDKPTWQEIVEHAQKGAELQERLRPIYTAAKRTIHTDSPIFLVHMADLHLGAPATDYQSFLDTTDLLKSDDRFYFVVVGPDLETAFAWFRSAEAILNQTIPPWMQLEAWRLWLDGMQSRCVAVCGDNHSDERLERNLGDIGVCWREDIPYFRTWGVLDLILDDGKTQVTYQEMMAHRYRGSSIYHDLQPALRMMRTYPDADCYTTAHTHKPAHLWGSFYEGQDMKHLMVCGTFKTGPDLFTMRNYIRRGILGLPTLKLWPGKKQIAWYPSPQMALES